VQITAQDQTTVGWLLASVRAGHGSPNQVLALRTETSSEVLDAWLLDELRVLYPLKDKERLVVVYREQVARPIAYAHFNILKVLGRGGFSQVTLGRA
jgi:hypothetical protein